MRKSLSVMAVVLALTACGQPLAPRRLADLLRTRVIAGRPAVQLLTDMHGGRFRPPNAVVAEYGRGRLTLYVAVFQGPTEAMASLREMVAALEKTDEFSPPRPLREDPHRYLTVGPGGHHLFWRSEAKVYWLAGEPEAVFAAVSELPPPPRGLLL